MKGDFSRVTFHPGKHYSSVRMQQGRVQLDADWNEQADITAHRIEAEAADLVGGCGGPLHYAAFRFVGSEKDLTPGEALLRENHRDPQAPDLQGPDFLITAGRYYVDGILCQNERIIPFTGQEDLPGFQADANSFTLTPELKKALLEKQTLLGFDLPDADGTFLAYLDVWRRHITPLEDPQIREVALNGPDTATRAKTVWQVKLLRVGDLNANVNCLTEPAGWNKLIKGSTGQLKAQAKPEEKPTNVCIVPASAGYRRLENQLYRVEIHHGGDAKTATFKWSRENGSIVTRWLNKQGNDLTVESIGRDEFLSFSAGDWVELTDDTRELWGLHGTLVQLAKAEGQTLTILPNTATGSTDLGDFPRNPKVRRWDHGRNKAITLRDGTIPLEEEEEKWLELEDGVQVCFKERGTYRTGDYWLIPARTAIGDKQGDIEWPHDSKDDPIYQSPHGIQHHYCRLAILNYDDTNKKFSLPSDKDCRRLFPPVTELTSLLYVGGDGQEAMPGRDLDEDLVVRVANGQIPVVGAKVRFKVLSGGGTIKPTGETSPPDGLARCSWTLGKEGHQQVQVTLWDAADHDVPGQVVYFSANLSVASDVAYDPAKCTRLTGIGNVQDALDTLCHVRASDVTYDPAKCTNLTGVTNVQDAIDQLCQVGHGGCEVSVGPKGQFARLDEALEVLLHQNQTNICLCLIPGSHVFPGITLDWSAQKRPLHLKICGCGTGTRILMEKPLRLTGVASFTLCNVTVEFAPNIGGPGGALAFEHCAEVTLDSCRLYGQADEGPLVVLSSTRRASLSGNVIEPFSKIALLVPIKIFDSAGAEAQSLKKLFEVLDREKFYAESFAVADELAKQIPEQRKALLRKLLAVTSKDELRATLSLDGELSYHKLMAELMPDAPEPVSLAEAFHSIRAAAIRAIPATAAVLRGVSAGGPAVLRETENYVTLTNNQVAGIVSLGGLPSSTQFTSDELKNLRNFLKAENQMIKILGTMGTLCMAGNELTRVAFAEEIVQNIKLVIRNAIAQKPGIIAGVVESWFLSQNVFAAELNGMIAQHVALTSDDFSLNAKPLGPAAPPTTGRTRFLERMVIPPVSLPSQPTAVTMVALPPITPVGIIISDTAVVVANRSNGTLRPGIGVFARQSDKAANVDLLIDDA